MAAPGPPFGGIKTPATSSRPLFEKFNFYRLRVFLFREVKKLPKLIYSYDLMKKSSKEAKKMARVGRFLHPDIRSGTKNIYARVERFKQQMVNETQGILFAFIEIK